MKATLLTVLVIALFVTGAYLLIKEERKGPLYYGTYEFAFSDGSKEVHKIYYYTKEQLDEKICLLLGKEIVNEGPVYTKKTIKEIKAVPHHLYRGA